MNAIADKNPKSTLGADLLSGFLVFLIALPLCLGIALASGFPAIAGVLTAVVGGLLGPFLGSARLTIKGPAAGLISIAIGAVTDLGHGDMMLGYRRALAVGVVAASLQIIFAITKVGKLGTIFPPAVVHGMLAAIGVIIISKQAHIVMGVLPHSKGAIPNLLELPASLMRNNPEIFIIGGAALVTLFGWPMIKNKWAKKIPGPIVALVVTMPLGLYFGLDQQHQYNMFGHAYDLGPSFLLDVPGNLLSVLTLPDFSVIASPASINYIVMFALVGTVESVLSAMAVDFMDPEKRQSDLNRDLLATGIANLICGFIGGLPMISEIVRSKANVDANAKSAWSNFFHGLFLLAFVVAVPGFLRHIPVATLAAMLIYIGARLASPAEVRHAKEVGLDQLLLFTTTLVVTIGVNLLLGVAVGVVLKLVMHTVRSGSFTALFRTKVTSQRSGDVLEVRIDGPATFLALLKLRTALGEVNDDVERVVIDVTAAPFVDHTFLERAHGMENQWTHAKLEVVGIEKMKPASEHPLASRRLARTQAQA